MATMREGEAETTTADRDDGEKRGPNRPLQFGLKTLLGITVAAALLFGTLRWLGVPPEASAMVLLVLVAGAVAAGGLAIVMAGWTPGEDDRE